MIQRSIYLLNFESLLAIVFGIDVNTLALRGSNSVARGISHVYVGHIYGVYGMYGMVWQVAGGGGSGSSDEGFGGVVGVVEARDSIMS